MKWRLVGTERGFCLDRLRQWVGQLGADAFRGVVTADPGSPERPTDARGAGLGKPDRDRLEHDLWLRRHHVPDLAEVMMDVLREVSGPQGPP